MSKAPPTTGTAVMGVSAQPVKLAVPSRRGRGRPARKPAPVSFFSVADAAKLLRTTPDHLRLVLGARFSFFRNSRLNAAGFWQVSSRDLERWLGRDELRPMLLLGEVAKLLRTTRARVHGAVRRGKLPAVQLFGDKRPGALRFNWLTVARHIGQDQGGLSE